MNKEKRTVEEYEKKRSEKPRRTVSEPTYEELICWCKLNIKQLLTIGYGDTDEHIEKHFGGEIGLLNVIDGYVQTLKNIYKLAEKEVI